MSAKNSRLNLVVVLVLAILPFMAIAQDEKIDSMKLALSNKVGMDRYDLLVALSVEYWNRNSISAALETVDEAQKIAFDSRDTSRMTKTSRMKGQILNRMEMIEESEQHLTRILPIAERFGEKNELRKIYINLALVYAYQARYDEALQYNIKSLEIAEESNDESAKSVSFNNIGFVYYKLRDYKKGLVFFKESLRLKRKMNVEYQLDYNLVNISLCYAYLNNFKAAKSYVDSAFLVCAKACEEGVIADGNFSLGVASLGINQLAQAERYFLNAYSIAKKDNDVRFQFDNTDYLSDIYIRRGDLEKAETILREAEKLIDAGVPFNLEKIKIYSRFVQLYLKESSFKKASAYQQKYIHLKDSIYNERLITNLMKIEADYLERENKARIAAQEEVLILNSKIIHNQKLTNIISIALAVVVIAFAGVLFRQYVRRKRDNTRLDRRVKERTHELEVNREALLKALDERDFILGQIHAEVRDALSRFRGLTSLSVTEIEDPLARQYFDEVNKTADDLSVSVANYFTREKRTFLA